MCECVRREGGEEEREKGKKRGRQERKDTRVYTV